MESITNFLRSDTFLYVVAIAFPILLLLFIVNVIKLKRLKANYNKVFKKLGNGSNLEEMLKKYIYEVENVSQKNQELNSYYDSLNKEIQTCIKKVGIVRYSAFKDTGSDLSFALALLNDSNSGIVLNGIYSPETSNIYAKPINNGKSTYTISEEERKAIDIAINS